MNNSMKRARIMGVSLILSIMLIVSACGSNTNTGAVSNAEPASPAPAASTSSTSEDEGAELLTPGTLTIGVDATYPPFESFNDKNEMIGLDIVIGEALAAKLGLKAKWVDTRFEGLIPGLNAKKFDTIISAISITEDRAKAVDFVPYFSLGQNYVALKESGITVKDDHDIEGMNVAVLTGSIHYNLLNDTIVPNLKAEGKGDVKVSSYPTTPEAVQQVIKGTADIAFLDSPVAGDMLKQFDKLELVSPIINPKNAGIVVRKGDSEMAALIEKGLKELEADGTLEELFIEYGVASPVIE